MFQRLQHEIEVTLEKAILNDAVFFKFAFSMSLGYFCCHFPRVLQDFPICCFNEFNLSEFPNPAWS